jgi:hypothetical protein
MHQPCTVCRLPLKFGATFFRRSLYTVHGVWWRFADSSELRNTDTRFPNKLLPLSELERFVDSVHAGTAACWLGTSWSAMYAACIFFWSVPRRRYGLLLILVSLATTSWKLGKRKRIELEEGQKHINKPPHFIWARPGFAAYMLHLPVHPYLS